MAFDGQPRAGPSYGGKIDAVPNARATGAVLSSALATAYWVARGKSRLLTMQGTPLQGTNFATAADGKDWIVATDYVDWTTTSVYVPDEVTHLRAALRFDHMARVQSTAYVRLTATDAVAVSANGTGSIAVAQKVPIASIFTANTIRDFGEFRREGAREILLEVAVKTLTTAATWTLTADVYCRSDAVSVFDDSAIRPLALTVWSEVRETT